MCLLLLGLNMEIKKIQQRREGFFQNKLSSGSALKSLHHSNCHLIPGFHHEVVSHVFLFKKLSFRKRRHKHRLLSHLSLRAVPASAENPHYVTRQILRNCSHCAAWGSTSPFFLRIKPADTHLPQVANDGCIRPGVLSIQTHFPVFEDDKCE